MIKGNTLMVDVRNPDEISELAYDVKNITNIPLDSLGNHISDIPKDKQVILVCRTDHRSGEAFDLLKSKGFENVAVMKGGMLVWHDAGFPVKEGKPQEHKACCANPNSKDCNPDGSCKPTSTGKQTCCANPNSKDCNSDGTCKPKAVEKEKCCVNSKSQACCAKPETKTTSVAVPSTTAAQNHLEVYCFHGTRQCETCINMKANTKATLTKYFAEQLKNEAIVFSIIDVDDAENEKLAAKFQATGTALMINNVVNGKDHITDWSDFAFDKANDANKFMPELKSKIDAVLKK
jgi:rhodanese-related sulfurtransferase